MLTFVAIVLHSVSKCVNNPDMFFYICGELTVEAQRRSFTPVVKKTYELHLAENSGTLVPSYLLWYMCRLDKWLHGSRPSMHFAVQMAWREQKDHSKECYSCLTNEKDFFAKATQGIQYQNLHSAMRSVPRDGFPIPKPPMDCNFDKVGE